MYEPMFDTFEDCRKSQDELCKIEGERLSWYSSHPVRKYEERCIRERELRKAGSNDL